MKFLTAFNAVSKDTVFTFIFDLAKRLGFVFHYCRDDKKLKAYIVVS